MKVLSSSVSISVSENVRIHFQITGTAENRTTLRRIKRDSGIAIAPGAVDGDFDMLFDAGGLGIGNCRETLIFSLLAGFTTLWRILQSFVVKEKLFAARPNKCFAAIYTQYIGIFEFYLFGDNSTFKIMRIIQL